MKVWWNRLNSRERWILIGGMVVLVVTLGYLYFWSPLMSGVATQRQQLLSNQQDLKWINSAARRVIRLQQQGYSLVPKTAPVLTLVNASLSKNHLEEYLSNPAQPKEKAVIVIFEGVPFDKMMDWLHHLWIKDAIEVASIKVTKADRVGTVDAELVLAKQGFKFSISDVPSSVIDQLKQHGVEIPQSILNRLQQ